METDLTLSEKLLLLAIRPGKGGIMGLVSTSLDFTLLGAVILELALKQRVNIIDKRVEVISADYSTEAWKYLLEKMRGSSKPRKISHWMNHPTFSKRKLKMAIYHSLVIKKEIRLEDRHFLFIRWKKPFLHPAHHASQLIFKVKDIVSGGSDHPEDIYLLTLLEVTGLLRRIYTERAARYAARTKIKQFQMFNTSSESIRQAIETAKMVRSAIITSVAAAHASHV